MGDFVAIVMLCPNIYVSRFYLCHLEFKSYRVYLSINWSKKKLYPTVVYIYKRTNRLHSLLTNYKKQLNTDAKHPNTGKNTYVFSYKVEFCRKIIKFFFIIIISVLNFFLIYFHYFYLFTFLLFFILYLFIYLLLFFCIFLQHFLFKHFFKCLIQDVSVLCNISSNFIFTHGFLIIVLIFLNLRKKVTFFNSFEVLL